MKKMLIYIGVVVGVIIVALLCYIAYLFLSYQRIADKQVLTPETNNQEVLTTDQRYRGMTFNIGYGAYTDDYTFFMDGGKSSRAKDQATVESNMTGVAETTTAIDPTISFFQEVDQDGDRSRHVNEVAFLQEQFPNTSSVYAQNYQSAYLFYPFLDPIGQATSGLVTLAKSDITEAIRYSLPIETNFNKFFDLDRAFSVSHIPVSNGKELIAINVHLSAYTDDPVVQEAQINKLYDVMTQSYQAGHYVLVGGDFNHDMLGDSPTIFNTTAERHSWDQPFPESTLPEGFTIPKGTIAEDAIPTTRKLDIPYEPGVSYVSVLDGFMVSDNISVEGVAVHDGGFAYSDHNPVVIDFKLNEQ